MTNYFQKKPLTPELIEHLKEQELLNKFKSDNAMGKVDKVYIKAVGILHHKKVERIEENKELGRLDELELKESTLNGEPEEAINVPIDYFQNILKKAELANDDVAADKLVNGQVNLSVIRQLAKREKDYANHPTSTDSSVELAVVTKKFISKIGLNPTEMQLKKVLSQAYKASKHRLNESIFTKASALVEGKSFKRLLSEINVINEDYQTTVALKPLMKIEEAANQSTSIKANRIKSFKEFQESK
jgi:hypothetical protein